MNISRYQDPNFPRTAGLRAMSADPSNQKPTLEEKVESLALSLLRLEGEAEQLGAESTKTPDSSEDKYTGAVLKVLSSSPSSPPQDCFSKLVHCTAKELIGKEDNPRLREKCMKNAVGIFGELFRVSPQPFKPLKKEIVGQFVEFIEAFREKFKCDPPFRTFFKPPLDFLANKALIIACCQRSIDLLRDLEEEISILFREGNYQGRLTYLPNSAQLLISSMHEIEKYIIIIRSYHRIDSLIQDNKPQIDQLRDFEVNLRGFWEKLYFLLEPLFIGYLNPQTGISQIRSVHDRACNIKELAIDLDEDRSPLPLQHLCIDALLKRGIDSLREGFFCYSDKLFSSFVRCSLNFAAKELLGRGEFSDFEIYKECMKNVVGIFYELLRIFPQPEEKKRLVQLIEFIETVGKKFPHSGRLNEFENEYFEYFLKFPLNPTLASLSKKAWMVVWCQKFIDQLLDQLLDFEKYASNFSPEQNHEGLKTYLSNSKELPNPSFSMKIEEYIKVAQVFQLDDLQDKKPQIYQLRLLERHLSDLLRRLRDDTSQLHETDLNLETVINQIRDVHDRVYDIRKLVIDIINGESVILPFSIACHQRHQQRRGRNGRGGLYKQEAS